MFGSVDGYAFSIVRRVERTLNKTKTAHQPPQVCDAPAPFRYCLRLPEAAIFCGLIVAVVSDGNRTSSQRSTASGRSRRSPRFQGGRRKHAPARRNTLEVEPAGVVRPGAARPRRAGTLPRPDAAVQFPTHREAEGFQVAATACRPRPQGEPQEGPRGGRRLWLGCHRCGRAGGAGRGVPPGVPKRPAEAKRCRTRAVKTTPGRRSGRPCGTTRRRGVRGSTRSDRAAGRPRRVTPRTKRRGPGLTASTPGEVPQLSIKQPAGLLSVAASKRTKRFRQKTRCTPS